MLPESGDFIAALQNADDNTDVSNRKDVRYNEGTALGNTETNTSALKGPDIGYALMFGPYIPPFQRYKRPDGLRLTRIAFRNTFSDDV